ncbi:hypothetical protein EAb13_CDS0019 [Acinetobacter phage EAb13]|nr:hypothetical protein EAb13_CDS0019 [Acinetobacter phage EAb13]
MRQKYYVFYNWHSAEMRMKYDAVQGIVADNFLEAEQGFLGFVEEYGHADKGDCYVTQVMTERQYNNFLLTKGTIQ